MPRYLISFDAHVMDRIPAEDTPAVAKPPLVVVQESTATAAVGTQ